MTTLRKLGYATAFCLYTGLIVGGMGVLFGKSLVKYRAQPAAIILITQCKETAAVGITRGGAIVDLGAMTLEQARQIGEHAKIGVAQFTAGCGAST